MLQTVRLPSKARKQSGFERRSNRTGALFFAYGKQTDPTYYRHLVSSWCTQRPQIRTKSFSLLRGIGRLEFAGMIGDSRRLRRSNSVAYARGGVTTRSQTKIRCLTCIGKNALCRLRKSQDCLAKIPIVHRMSLDTTSAPRPSISTSGMNSTTSTAPIRPRAAAPLIKSTVW